MNTMKLEEAVVNSVNELKSRGNFSAYDITTLIRNKSNSGEWDLPGLEARQNNQNIRFWINHDDVKSILNELYNMGELTPLGLVDRSFNGTYLVYIFDTTNNAGGVTVSVSTSPAPSTPTKVTTKPSVNTGYVSSRASNFVRDQLVNAFTPTLKQVQSAVKVRGVTCEDFYDMLQRDFHIAPGNTLGEYSTYTVVSKVNY